MKLMRGSIYLGKIFGIKVLVHFTFFLIFIWVALFCFYNGMHLDRVLWECGVVGAAFICVILHEFGHALTAKRFGIQTRQILLLPIGGVAQLQRIPEKPMQELAVALGGPMVNVVIILALLPFVYITGHIHDVFDKAAISESFPLTLCWANAILLTFNLIPAFPMDGGRVLRALLTLGLKHKTATRVAARIGQVFALLFIGVGIYFSNYILVVIGIFVCVAAEYEFRVVSRKQMTRGFHVKDAMLDEYTILNPVTTLAEAKRLLQEGEERDFLVVEDNVVMGIITRPLLMVAITDENFGPTAYVGSVMVTNFPRLDPWQTLDYALLMMQDTQVGILPVVKDNEWIGAVNFDHIMRLGGHVIGPRIVAE